MNAYSGTNEFTSDDLEAIASHHGKPAVSIYIPTTRIPTRRQAESLQLRNLLRDAEGQLASYDLNPQQTRTILEPAKTLAEDIEFWRHPKDGIALFLSEDSFYHYQLAHSFPMQLHVSEAFHVKPLIPLLTTDYTFYILALSQNQVRLIVCTRFTVQEIDLADIPANMQEILDEYEVEKNVQFHTSASAPGAGRRGAVFYGQGAGSSEDEKAKILEFCQRVDRGVNQYLHNQGAPLVFAGVEYLFPIYKEANSYGNLLESAIAGNPEAIPASTLHRQARKLIEPSLAEQQTTDLEKFYSASANGLASTDLEAIVPWAERGRVEVAFVDEQAVAWGVYDPIQFKAIIQPEKTLHNRDLSDMVALYTHLRKGKVYLLTFEEMEMEFGPQNRHLSVEQQSSEKPATPVVAVLYRYAV